MVYWLDEPYKPEVADHPFYKQWEHLAAYRWLKTYEYANAATKNLIEIRRWYHAAENAEEKYSDITKLNNSYNRTDPRPPPSSLVKEAEQAIRGLSAKELANYRSEALKAVRKLGIKSSDPWQNV